MTTDFIGKAVPFVGISTTDFVGKAVTFTAPSTWFVMLDTDGTVRPVQPVYLNTDGTVTALGPSV